MQDLRDNFLHGTRALKSYYLTIPHKFHSFRGIYDFVIQSNELKVPKKGPCGVRRTGSN